MEAGFSSNIHLTLRKFRSVSPLLGGLMVLSTIIIGSVISESFNYSKELFPLEDGHIKWTLALGSKGYTNLTIGDRMTLKRMEPYNLTDHDNIIAMLDRAFQSITPYNVEVQLLS